MYNKYDLDPEQIKVSKKWVLEVGMLLNEWDLEDPKSIYFANKLQKMMYSLCGVVRLYKIIRHWQVQFYWTVCIMK